MHNYAVNDDTTDDVSEKGLSLVQEECGGGGMWKPVQSQQRAGHFLTKKGNLKYRNIKRKVFPYFPCKEIIWNIYFMYQTRTESDVIQLYCIIKTIPSPQCKI